MLLYSLMIISLGVGIALLMGAKERSDKKSLQHVKALVEAQKLKRQRHKRGQKRRRR